MNFFVYLRGPGEKEEKLLGTVAPFISEGSLEIFRDLSDFADRLRKLKSALSIALIWITGHEELKELGSWRDFLAGVRTILILPDDDPATLALAHKIFPVYIAYSEDDMSEVAAVVRRLVRPGEGSGKASDAPGRRGYGMNLESLRKEKAE